MARWPPQKIPPLNFLGLLQVKVSYNGLGGYWLQCSLVKIEEPELIVTRVSLLQMYKSLQILCRIHMLGQFAKGVNYAHVQYNVQCAQVHRITIIMQVKKSGSLRCWL